MRIGIDARELGGRATGVGRYLAGLLAAWASDDQARSHEFVLYSAEPIAIPLDARRFPTRTIPGPAGTWWEQVRLPAALKRDHLDLFFSPAYTAPRLSSPPLVVAIHDVSFAAHPEWFTVREGARRRWMTRSAARRARAVLTISQFSRREIVDRLGIPDERIHVIPPGVTGQTPTSASEQSSRHSEPTVLYAGSIFNRRRIPDLLRGFAPIARSHPEAALELVGDNRTYPAQNLPHMIASAGLSCRARWRRYVPDDELSMLYRTARAFAFLSEYEGLGLTPLEALANGVPPVLLDTEVARESCGNAALYVAAGDLGGLTHALEQLLFDDDCRSRILAAAPALLARYDWRRAARETLNVLESSAS